MAQVLKEFQFSVRALRQDRGAEWFHDLLDSHSLTGELVLCGAISDGALERRSSYLNRRWSTRQGQRLPSRPVVGPYTCSRVNSARCWSGDEVPAGDLEGRTKNLGPYKLGHDELMAEAVEGKRSYGKGEMECTGENNNLIVVAAVADRPGGLATLPYLNLL